MSAFLLIFRLQKKNRVVLLDHKELSKYRNGEYRWELFLRKIKKGEFFEHKNGVSIQIMPENLERFEKLIRDGVKTGAFSKDLAKWKFEVVTCVEDLTVGNLVGLRDLVKTVEFGAAGVSASAITKWVEYSVANKLANELGGSLSSISYEKKPEKMVQTYLYTTYKVDDTVKGLLESEFLTGFQGAIVHFRDAFVKEILNMYKILSKRDKFWGIARFDKWNPADIWITKGSVDVKSCTSLEELANLLYSPVCVGISLKKAGTKPVLVEGFGEKETIRAGSVKVVGNYNPKSSITTLKVEGIQANGNPLSIGIRPMNGNFRLEVLEHAYRKGGCGRELFDEAGRVTGFYVKGLTIRGIQNKIYNATFDSSQAEVLAKFLTEVSKYAQSKASGHCPFIVTY